MQGPRAMPAPPARPPRHHRRVSSSDNGRRPSSVYSQDTRRHSNGHQRPISKLIRRDSLDNRPPARPPRPRESLDMSLFVDRTDASPVTAAMAALEQALGPMEQTPAVTEKAWMASPRRIPPPSVGPSTTTIAAAAPPLTSLVSSGTTKTTMGRRATRREDVRRIASLLGAEALSGVDVEAIVQMERNRPKTQEVRFLSCSVLSRNRSTEQGQHRPARNSLILLDNLPPSRDIDLTPNVVSSAPTPEVGKARPTSAPSPSRKNTLFGKMTSKLHSRPHSHSSAPRQPATKPDIRRLNCAFAPSVPLRS